MSEADTAELYIADPTIRLAPPPGRAALWTSAPFLLMAVVCAAFAFVGLASSSYWVDELFSLFVVNHGGGLGEVVRRALTDTHPPAYYFLLYPLTQAFGTSEAVTRGFSAGCAVAALVVFFFGLKDSFSLPARSFALALAASSKAFIENSQTARGYALCMLVAAGLLALALALHRRLARREPLPFGLTLAFWALASFGAFIHFYMLLLAGGVHLFLLLSARTWRSRAVIAASGLLIIGLVGLYIVSLLHNTQQPLGHMWFSNQPKHLLHQILLGVGRAWSGLTVGGLVILALAPLRERLSVADRVTVRPQRISFAPLALAGAATLVTLGIGLAVSILFVPSFGERNLMVLMPFWWMVAAWLYDRAQPDPRQWVGKAIVLVLIATVALNLVQLRGRFLPLQEDWRGSAAYVDSRPACAHQPIPVVLPWVFGPATPFFRDLAQRYFFGRYEVEPDRLRVYAPWEFEPTTAVPAMRELLQQRAAGGCPVLAWGVHDLDDQNIDHIRRALAATAGLPPERVVIHRFYRQKVKLFGKLKAMDAAYVFEATRP